MVRSVAWKWVSGVGVAAWVKVRSRGCGYDGLPQAHTQVQKDCVVPIPRPWVFLAIVQAAKATVPNPPNPMNAMRPGSR